VTVRGPYLWRQAGFSVAAGGAGQPVADAQIADPLLHGPDLRVVGIQVGIEQCLAIDRIHSHARFDVPRTGPVPGGDVTVRRFASD